MGLNWQLQRSKLLTAVQRIRLTDKPNWSALAYELGYSSQQHFITDFKRIVGKTPLQYKREFEAGPRFPINGAPALT